MSRGQPRAWHDCSFLSLPLAQFVPHDLTMTAGPISLQYVYIFPGAAPIVGHGRDCRQILRIELHRPDPGMCLQMCGVDGTNNRRSDLRTIENRTCGDRG